MVQLSKRLQAVADFVDNCDILADVGTDHGYIPVYLVGCGKVKKAIALDVNQGPLLRAEAHIRRYHMEDRIEIRLSDGCRALRSKEADVIVIAGMGGGLMMRILRQGEQAARAAGTLVLQPQSELMAFREFLYENGYEITAENMVQEEGKYYPVIKARAGGTGAATVEFPAGRTSGLRYGPLLLAQKHPVLKEYLLGQQRQKQKILLQLEENARQNAKERMAQVQEELQELELALSLFENRRETERRII